MQSETLFGEPISKSEQDWKQLGPRGFIRGAKVPPIIVPPPKLGTRRIRVVDSFAGGGGASNGIEDALQILHAMELLPVNHGLHVDFAVNHDPSALAMHAVNHPNTIHLPHNVWKVSMRELLGDDLFGLLWLSPDCRDHSPAKGKPITSRSVRDLAWVLVRWLKELPDWQRPYAIFLENVPAFTKWSPLIPANDGGYERDKSREGEIFYRFVMAVARFGYSVGWRDDVVACEYGSPTIRKRLQMVFRRDGQPIVWPEPTHAHPKSEAVKTGKLKPWPVAADIVDFDLPTPSVLMTKEEAAAYTKATGIKIIRPLARKSEARVAKGVKRHVLGAAEPFMVTCNHAGDGFRGQPLSEPMATVTRARDAHGLVVPHMVSFRGDQIGRPANEALSTVTANSFQKRPGGASPIGVAVTGMVPIVSYGQHGGGSRSVEEAVHTIKASSGDQNQVIAAYVAQYNNDSRRTDGVNPGRPASEPISAVTASGAQQGVVAVHMLSLKGSDRRDYTIERPLDAVCASGQHSALISLPLMTAYYSTGGQHANMTDPMLAVPTKARFGYTEAQAMQPPLPPELIERARAVANFLRKYDCWDDREFVTLERHGVVWILYDIGMRMLKPRELARAQDFPDSYILAAPYKGRVLSETDQRHKIGNSVCRKPAAAHIVANYRPPLDIDVLRGQYQEAAE